MARLDLYRDGQFRTSLSLTDRNYIIGRDPTCDLVLEDRGASRRHFRLVFRTDGEYSLEDIDTPNGTVVNGSREYGRVLMGQCTLQVGRDLMLFDPHAQGAADPECTQLPPWAEALPLPPTEHPDGGPPSTAYVASDRMKHVQGQERARMRPHLVSNLRRGRRVLPLDNSKTQIGFGHFKVSLGPSADGKDRLLAEVLGNADEGYRVKARGLFAKIDVNGDKKRDHPLQDGDVMRFGMVEYTFRPGLVGGPKA